MMHCSFSEKEFIEIQNLKVILILIVFPVKILNRLKELRMEPKLNIVKKVLISFIYNI